MQISRIISKKIKQIHELVNTFYPYHLSHAGCLWNKRELCEHLWPQSSSEDEHIQR